jgi:hypothetical protein
LRPLPSKQRKSILLLPSEPQKYVRQKKNRGPAETDNLAFGVDEETFHMMRMPMDGPVKQS